MDESGVAWVLDEYCQTQKGQKGPTEGSPLRSADSSRTW